MTGETGVDPALFLVLTVGIMGGAGWMAGQAIASTWRPLWPALAAGLMIGIADRFLLFALFGRRLQSIEEFILDAAVITAICACAWRVTRARRMVSQYPWLYERAGPFGWRERRG